MNRSYTPAHCTPVTLMRQFSLEHPPAKKAEASKVPKPLDTMVRVGRPWWKKSQ